MIRFRRSGKPRILTSPLLLLLAIAAPASAITLDPAIQRRLGILTTSLKMTKQDSDLSSFAHVIDPVPLVTLDSDLATAAANAAASQAEAARTRTLAAADATVARKVSEAATAQARGDAAKVALLRRRLALEWGSGIARSSDGERHRLIEGIVAGRTALLRIDSPDAVGWRNVRAAMLDLGTMGTVPVRMLGPARIVDPGQAAAGRIALVSGRAAAELAVGMTIPVELKTGDAPAGVTIPAAAILRSGGASWAYVRSGTNRFDRRRLVAPIATQGGLFVTQGFAAGEAVVIRGGAQLFTAEHATAKSAAGDTD
ncbi:hypothetical protein SAMN05444678_1179 [Sphingomonas sp. YR710]|nr:hypothetical protein SAMN05444678_1179 [Sphingomonas sp. YR710]